MGLIMPRLRADKLNAAFNYETREVPVLALVMDQPGKLGPLLQQHPDDAPCPTTPMVPSPAPTAPPEPEKVDTRFPITCGGILHIVSRAPGPVRAGGRSVAFEQIADP